MDLNQVSSSPEISEGANIPRKSNTKKKILILLSIVIIWVLIVVLLFVAIFGSVLWQTNPKEQRTTVSNFLEATSKQDYDSAYNLTSTEFKQVVPERNFAQTMSSSKSMYSEFKSLENFTFSETSRAKSWHSLYSYSGRITYQDGGQGNVYVDLVKEGDGMKIINIYVDIPPSRSEEFNEKPSNSPIGVLNP
jgi:flagellar basal body-associated protein FliL